MEQNYGKNYDKWHAGLVGPIEVVGRKGDETIIKDISSHKWSYKVGLHGWDHKFFSEDSLFASPSKWESEELPTNRMVTWYKVIFIFLSKMLWSSFCFTKLIDVFI